MGSLAFIKNFSPKLPALKKPRPAPTAEQILAAERSLASLHETLKANKHGVVIRVHKQGEGVEFHSTGELRDKHLKKHSPLACLQNARKTNKQIRRAARVLHFHSDLKVSLAADALLRDYDKHLALPQNTITLRTAVRHVHEALTPTAQAPRRHSGPTAQLIEASTVETSEDSSEAQQAEQAQRAERAEQAKRAKQAKRVKRAPKDRQIDPGARADQHLKQYLAERTPAFSTEGPTQRPGVFIDADSFKWQNKEAAMNAPDQRFTAIVMLEVLIYLQQQSANELLHVSGERVCAHAGPVQAERATQYREFALQIQAMGLVYANYPEHGPDAVEIRSAAAVLLGMSNALLDDANGVQAVRNGPELIQALTVIVEKCARNDRPDVKAFYAEQTAAAANRRALEHLKGDALRQRGTVGEGAGEWKADRATAAEMYKYLYWRAAQGQQGQALYLVRKPSGESCLSHKNTFFVAPTFDKDEDEARLRGVDPQAGPSAAKLIQQLGEQFAAHSNAAVAAAAEDLLDIAAPVLATDGTAQPCAMGSDRLMNALATIALQGVPEAAK